MLDRDYDIRCYGDVTVAGVTVMMMMMMMMFIYLQSVMFFSLSSFSDVGHGEA